MAQDPSDNKWKFFIDKCLPFGASISCALYQCFSNSLKHIIQFRTGKRVLTNYLDDFLFAAITKMICDWMIEKFIKMCQEFNIPVAMEKTEWSSTLIIFLGILLNDCTLTLSIPLEKRDKALKLLNDLMGKRKITVKQLQVLTGFLNFLTKAIFPGRVFTRRIYNKFAAMQQKGFKPHQNVTIDSELRFDCEVWRIFLENYRELAVCRPMVDVNQTFLAKDLFFYSDASAAKTLGMGAVYNKHWLYKQWETDFIKLCKPSIEYLELYALTAGLLTWGHLLTNQHILVYCDNSAVVSMINNTTSSCKNCMYLLRLIVLNNLIYNRRVFAQHVKTQDNFLADSMSHLQFKRFWNLAPAGMDRNPSKISPLIWLLTKIWVKH